MNDELAGDSMAADQPSARRLRLTGDLASPGEERGRLTAGEVHLWLARAATEELPDAWLSLERTLSPEESAQLARRLRIADRHLFLVAHTLLRVVLAHYLDCEPGDVALGAGAHGRPLLLAAPELHISLTHSGGVVACAVTGLGAVGVDVEAVDRRASPMEIADRFFGPGETAMLQGLPAARRPRRFFLLWTLKEAVLKAAGTGLTVPLASAGLKLAGRHGWRLTLTGPLEALAPGWWLASLGYGRKHLVSVAVNTPREVEALRCRQVWVTPGQALTLRCVGAGATAGSTPARLLSGSVLLAQLER
jgi:4'-phosphopantetheinyl transferase